MWVFHCPRSLRFRSSQGLCARAQLSPPLRAKTFMKSLVLGVVRVPLKGGGGGADAFSISGAREAELPGKFAGVEEVGRIVLIEHFVSFRDLRIEPSCKPDHGPAQNTIFWRNAKF